MTVTPPVFLVAAGGLAREVLAGARMHGLLDVRGFLDESPQLRGREVDGVPVLGGLEVAAREPRTQVVVCAGRGAAREAIVERLAAAGVTADRYATYVDPSVRVPDGSSIGAGSVLLAGVVLTTAVRIGRHVVVMPQATFTHDDVVEDFATVAAGVSLGGGVRIGRAAYLGMNASVREGVRVGARVTIGMGAAVLKDVPDGEVWAGVPARRLADVTDRPTTGSDTMSAPDRGEREATRTD